MSVRGGMAGAFALMLVLAGCSPPPPARFFEGTWFEYDRLYRNAALGFAFQFRGNWSVAITPHQMSPAGRKAARALEAEGRELLFTAATVEGSQGCRGIVDHLNLTNTDYLAGIREANRATIEEDYGAESFQTPATTFLKWEYRFAGMRFVEFLFRNGTYNIRIAFWTDPQRYEHFLPEYERMMRTLVFTDRL